VLPIRIPVLRLALVAVLSACSQATTSPAGAQLGARLRVWKPDSAAVLASESNTRLYSATQMVVDDSLTWRAMWEAIYRNNLTRPPLPAVDFTAHSVLVYGLGALYASLRLDSIGFYELGNAAYLTDVRPGSNCAVPGVVLTPVVAVRAAQPLWIRVWILRDVVQACS
jgi:hypothetical protein